MSDAPRRESTRHGSLDATLERLAADEAMREALVAIQPILALGSVTERAALVPERPGGIPHAVRTALALRIARLEGDAALGRALARRLANGDTPAALASAADPAWSDAGEPRLAAMLAFVDVVTTRPRTATAADVERLRTAGIEDADIVRLAALTAFLAYRCRLTRGLELTADEAGAGETTSEAAAGARAGETVANERVDEAVADERTNVTGGSAAPGEIVHDFTLTVPHWRPRVRPVDLETATPEQRAAFAETPSGRGVSDYVLVLAHDPETLQPRSPLFNAIMYGRGGLGRAERELAATAASVVNRCVYCAAVHASRHAQLVRDESVALAVLAGANGASRASGESGSGALDARDRSIVRFARALSHSPPTASRADVAALRALGLTERELLDLILSSALFGWANRLMHVLGDPVARRTEEDGE